MCLRQIVDFLKCIAHIADQRPSDEASLQFLLLRCCFAFSFVAVTAGIVFSPLRGIAWQSVRSHDHGMPGRDRVLPPDVAIRHQFPPIDDAKCRRCQSTTSTRKRRYPHRRRVLRKLFALAA